MTTAYFDLIGGAAGDMLLGALLDAGAPGAELSGILDRLGLGARLETGERMARYLRACRVEVHPPAGEQPHRHLSDILALVARAELPKRAAERAERAFRALAEAEGRVHGIAPEAVHFHEVGAIDSIVDTVGVCVALELLGVERVVASPFPLGHGVTSSAHGALPLPAPATLYLLEQAGAPVVGRDAPGEHVTPTAAALLTTLAEGFGPCPALRVARVGYGAGSRQSPPERPPNVTRVVLGQSSPPAGETPQEVVVLEANLDDQTPERTAYLAEQLLAAGALDVFLTPVQMKKGRPGVVVTVLAEASGAGALGDLLLCESSTLGVRRRVEQRSVLPRSLRRVTTRHGEVRVKITRRPDGRSTAAPEFEDCARLARAEGVPLDVVFRAAVRAAERPG